MVTEEGTLFKERREIKERKVKKVKEVTLGQVDLLVHQGLMGLLDLKVKKEPPERLEDQG